MPLTALTCKAPVRRLPRPTTLDPEVLDEAIALHAEGAHLASVARTLTHLLPGHTIGDLRTQPLVIVQGSSRVTVHVAEGAPGRLDLDVRVPMIRLSPEGNPTAALRYLLTRVAGSGQLYQPRLYDEDVVLEFRESVARLHPIKLLEVLRRMPVEADARDDWMIDQFGALPLDREPVVGLTVEELAEAEAIWDTHWAEVEELIKESQRKRSLFFLNELTAFTLYHLRSTLPLTGALATRINESARVFHDADEDPSKREAALAKCAKEMRAVSRGDLRKNLGHAQYAVAPHEEGTLEVLNQQLSNDNLESIRRVRTAGNAMDATLAMVSTFSFLLARYGWPEPIAEDLVAGLTQASGRPWREASQALLGHGRELLERASTKPGEDAADASDATTDTTSEEQPS